MEGTLDCHIWKSTSLFFSACWPLHVDSMGALKALMIKTLGYCKVYSLEEMLGGGSVMMELVEKEKVAMTVEVL